LRTLIATAAALLFTSAAAAALILPRSLPGALLELAHLLLHVAASLRVLLRAELVVTAVRAALPALGIGTFAARAKDGFWQRHRKSARIVHFGPWTNPGGARCWH
jgi:hypothetical protein